MVTIIKIIFKMAVCNIKQHGGCFFFLLTLLKKAYDTGGLVHCTMAMPTFTLKVRWTMVAFFPLTLLDHFIPIWYTISSKTLWCRWDILFLKLKIEKSFAREELLT